MGSKPKPTLQELAEMKMMSNKGISPYTIAKKMGKSNHTISKYLKSDIFNDPNLQQLIQTITKREQQDLLLIGQKSRLCQHQYLDSVLLGEKQPNPIAITAIGDRAFGQRRLLLNQSTANIDISQQITELETIRTQALAFSKKLRNPD
tara:strand:+ start:4140 stop:4583 length:444 start_codon:yes stop_codon:yes gene_type:complete